MLKIATEYYKNLFSFETRPNIRMRPDFFSNEERIRLEENVPLESNFS
jgi:hypothetical protein